MKTRIQFTQLVMVLALLAAPMMALAQGKGTRGSDDRGDFERGRHHNAREQRMEAIPDLTEEQKQKMETVHLAVQKDILPIKNQINEKEAKLKTLQTADKVDMKSIYAVIDEVSGLKSKIAKRQAEAHQSIRELLTDDQRIVFDNHFGKRGGGRRSARR